jgi:glycosyltransferase involved in cell wall biosynthesis
MEPVQQERPLISVIMPCLNAERFLGEAVASVIEQTLSDLELIVIDNGSTDRTPDILRSFGDRRLCMLRENERGVSRARNTGLRHARGAFVAFLDADDTWAPDFLRKLHAVLASRPDAALAYCGWQNVGLEGPRGEPYLPPDYEGAGKMAELLVNNRWPIHAALTRRSSIAEVGGFDTRLIIAEDYLFWLELAARGTVIRVPEVLARYRHHSCEQATGNRALASLHVLQAKHAFLRRHPEIAAHLGEERIESLTWGHLLQEGNALYWHGDLEHARPVLRRALLAGRGTLLDRLRMLPTLLPLKLHRAIVAAKDRMEAR